MNNKIEDDYFGPRIFRWKDDTDGEEYWSDACIEDLLDEVQRDDFHIGQCYTYNTCKTYICKECGSDHFIVGTDDHYTAIKCSKCKYEIAIHQG